MRLVNFDRCIDPFVNDASPSINIYIYERNVCTVVKSARESSEVIDCWLLTVGHLHCFRQGSLKWTLSKTVQIAIWSFSYMVFNNKTKTKSNCFSYTPPVDNLSYQLLRLSIPIRQFRALFHWS